jgi:hypothetical protein
MVPKAIKDAFHDWVAEVMNQGVHVHSKVIVIDPFGAKPIVMTGSHNLGHKASTANDDNLMIVEGNAALAAAYAVNIIAIYQTYRWNTYVDAHEKDPQVWHGLAPNDGWQPGYLKGDNLAEIEFWLGEVTATQSPSSTAPAAGPAPARAATATGPSPHKGKGRAGAKTSGKKPSGKKSHKTASKKSSAHKTKAKQKRKPPRKKTTHRRKK